MSIDFAEAMVPDSVPETENVFQAEYPCRVCGAEAGPYSGRGPKPKLCPLHKKGNAGSGNRAPRITGNAQNLAAQATGVLVQLNSMIALGVSALGLFQTGGSIAAANEQFEAQAYQALLTDPELCRLILKSGGKSAKLSLAIAYGGMGMTVIPTAIMEAKEKKAVREAKRLAEENEAGT